MHAVKNVQYVSGYKLFLTFEDASARLVDLKPHLKGEIFEPLKDLAYFKRVRINEDLDTIVWDNGADFSPDFLYEISADDLKPPQKPTPIAWAWAWFSGIHTVWIMVALLLAFAQLIILRGSSLWLLPGVMMPPSFAVLCAASPTTSRMGRVAAGIFLALISVGEALAYCPSIFPGMGEHEGLPVSQDRLIEWYFFAFVMYVFVVWPPMLFGDHLWRRHRGDASAFSRFTCWLGIGAWLFIGPLMAWSIVPLFLKRWQ